MKHTKTQSNFAGRTSLLSTALALGHFFAPAISRAATLNWDTVAGDGATVTAGSGTWDLSAVGWNNAGADVAWTQTSATAGSNVAVFGGTDGTYSVTLGANLAAQSGLAFNASGYTLSAAGAQTLNVNGTGIVTTVAAGKTATIGNNVTVGFNNAGAGNNSGTRLSVGAGSILNVAAGGILTRTAGVAGGGDTAGTNGTIGFIGTGTVNIAGTVSYTGSAVTAGGVLLATTNADSLTVNVNSGGLLSSTTTANGLIMTNNAGATATLNLNSGGTVHARIVRTVSGTSNFNFNGGTLKAAANQAAFMTGLTNATVQSGGAIIDTNGFDVTIAQNLLNGGGGLTKNGAGPLTLTGANAYTGGVTVSAGTLNANSASALGSSTAALSVASGATLNLGAGITLGGTVTGGGAIRQNGTANVVFSGNFSGFTGSYVQNTNNNNTQVTATNATSANASYDLAINHGASGGLLLAVTGGGTYELGSLSGVAGSTLRNAGAVTGTSVLQVGNLNTNTIFAGNIGGGGGTLALTKVGTGSLTLSGTTTHNGATSVNAGTLVFSNVAHNLATSTVSVADGATLGTKAIASGAPLTTSSLTLGTSGASSLSFDFNNLDPIDPQIFTTDLTVNGPVSVSLLNANYLGAGSYKLIDYSLSPLGSGSFPAGPIAIGTRGTGIIQNNVGDESIDLVVQSTDRPKWSGLDGGAWAVGATGAQKNWKLVNANTATDYIEGDIVLFNDSATGTKSVTINSANVTPTATSFDTATNAYSLSGSFGIAGTGGLTKTGSGTVTIANANTYTGGTLISEGTLQLGNGTTDGSIASTSGVTNDGTLAYNVLADRTTAYAITGVGSVTKTGAGALTFTGANTYSGGTTVNGGVLASTSNGLNNGPIVVNAGGTLTFTGNNQTATSTLTGAGAILNNTANTIIITGDHSGFSGAFTHNAATNNTQFNSASSASQNASYSLLDGELLFAANGDYTVKFGSLASNAGETIRGGNTATGLTTLEVGNLGTSTAIAGPLNNGATKALALTKVGNGNLTLGSTNTYTGPTTVNAGTLTVNGSLTASSAVTVAAGAGLKGTGTVAGTVSAAGTIAPGTSIGTLVTGATSLSGTLAIEIDGANGADKLVSSGFINISGATLTVTNLGGGFAGPYVIAEGTSITGTFGSVPSGYSVTIQAGGAGQQAVLNSTGGTGYAGWASANAPGQTINQDHDGDGVPNGIEYFMGLSGSSFTTNPGPTGGTVTWTMGASYTGVYGTDYVVQSCDDLVSWATVPQGTGDNTVTITPGTSVVYDLPTGGKRFVRLVVTN